MAETLTEPRAAVAAMNAGPGALELAETAGFLVADVRGRLVGRVEGPMYGSSAADPDALSVRFSLLRWRRRIVPVSAIAAIDNRAKIIGLCVDRSAVETFL